MDDVAIGVINDSGDIVFTYHLVNGEYVAVARYLAEPGLTQHDPILPSSAGGSVYRFEDVESGMWFDPPFVPAIEYSMTSGVLFTNIVDFPSGFAGPFTVTVGDIELGSFGPGDNVDFSGFASGGVEQFTVSGITPLVDSADPQAFPLQIAFIADRQFSDELYSRTQ